MCSFNKDLWCLSLVQPNGRMTLIFWRWLEISGFGGSFELSNQVIVSYRSVMVTVAALFWTQLPPVFGSPPKVCRLSGAWVVTRGAPGALQGEYMTWHDMEILGVGSVYIQCIYVNNIIYIWYVICMYMFYICIHIYILYTIHIYISISHTKSI